MKRVIAVAVLGILGACASTQLSASQAVVAFCAAAPDEIDGLETEGVITGGAADTMDQKVRPAINGLCASGSAITAPSIQSVSKVAIPALLDLVDASDLSDADKKTDSSVLLGLQVTLNVASAYYGTPVATSGAPAQ